MPNAVSPRLRQQDILLHHVLLEDGHAIEIDAAGLKFRHPDIQGFLRFHNARGKVFHFILRLHVHHHTVFDFLGGGQNFVLVRRHDLLELRSLVFDVVPESAIVEHIPLKGRAVVALEGERREELIELRRLPAERAGD